MVGAPRRSGLSLAVWRAGIRPTRRSRELGLLLALGLTLLLGWVGLATTRSGRLDLGAIDRPVSYIVALLAVHVAFVVSGRRLDQLLLPAVGMLGGLSLLLMQRLPQDLVQGQLGDLQLGLVGLQWVWLMVGCATMAAVAILVRSDGWLRYYKYSWAAAGIGLLLLVFVLGEEANGARLSLTIGPVTGQPSELLKVILVVFLAAYLADNRPMLARESTRIGPFRIPPLPYLLPMLAMWGIAILVVVVQRDLGAALLFFSLFLALLYIGTRRASYVVLGITLFVIGASVLYQAFPHVRTRVDVWLDPYADPLGAGYQSIHALYAFGRGGILGTGLGAGLPQVGTALAIPLVHTDFVFAALAEELGLLGSVALCGIYLVIAERGLRIAARAADAFQALLAAGLTLVIVLQAALIMAGTLRLVPLTGITLPFVSYGGSSLLSNAVVIGLLLALSDGDTDRVVPPPTRPGRRADADVRLRGAGAG